MVKIAVDQQRQARLQKPRVHSREWNLRRRISSRNLSESACQFGRISHTRIWLPIWFALYGLQLYLMNGMRAVRDSSLDA
jgi:hypothetical protein